MKSRLWVIFGVSVLVTLFGVTCVLAESQTAAGDILQTQFEQIDTNGDEKISHDEYMNIYEERFKKKDTNGDGFLTREEAEEKATKIKEKVLKRFRERTPGSQ